MQDWIMPSIIYLYNIKTMHSIMQINAQHGVNRIGLNDFVSITGTKMGKK